MGQLVLGQHIGQGLALSRVKVQQSVINVQKDASVNGHFKMTLLFLVYWPSGLESGFGVGVGVGVGVGAALTCSVKTASAPLLTAWIW